MVVDSIQEQRNAVLLRLWMNGGSLTMNILRECLENLVLRKCLQTRVTITLMTLTLWKSSVHVLHLCFFSVLSYHCLEHSLTISFAFTYFMYIDKHSINKLIPVNWVTKFLLSIKNI